MEMNRLKISDGDLIVITMGGELTQSHMSIIREKFEQWIGERGLQECRVLVMSGVGEEGISIKVLSVNNIFEDEVLNKK